MEFHYSEPKSNYSGSLGRCNVQSQSTPPLIMGQACFKGITAIVFQTAKVKNSCAFSNCSNFHVLPRDPNKFLDVSIWLRETLGVKFPEKSFFPLHVPAQFTLKQLILLSYRPRFATVARVVPSSSALQR